MRLNTGKKLKTDSLNLKSTGFRKEECTSTCSRLKPKEQRWWSREHKARGQGQKKNPRPRPRTALPRTDPLEAKDRNVRGQGPRTESQVFSKKTEKVFKIFFQAISKKGKQKRFSKFFREVFGVFLHNFYNKQIPTVVETDANTHRAIWEIGDPPI